MRVLFLGEFSGVFSELIPALHKLGVETFLISDGGGYKKYPADFYITSGLIKSKIFHRILQYSGFLGILNFRKNWPQLKSKLSGYDIVQINNDYPFKCYGWIIELYILHYVIRHNKKLFLSAWGDDYIINRWLCSHNLQVFQFMSKLKKFYYRLNLFFTRRLVNTYITRNVQAICPGTYYYLLAYKRNSKTYNGIIPFPLNFDKLNKPLQINSNDQIVIFHGWQLGKEKEKGNDIFDRVIRRVVDKYESKVKYVVVHNTPYEEYCKLFSKAHIFIDQLYADDKGMNGLLGMAAGKVVFSGFMPEALALYPRYKHNIIGIRAYNNEDYLYSKFCELIDNPNLMVEISHNAIDFIIHNHLNEIVAQQYIALWRR